MGARIIKRGFLLAGMLMSLLVTTNSCDIEEPDFSNLRDFKLIKMDGTKLEVQFTVDCDNPNGFGFKVKKSKLNVSVDDEVLGVISLDEKIKIKRKSTNSYTVPVVINLESGALFRILKYVTCKEVSVKLEGKIKGSVMGFAKSFDVNETRKIDGKLFNLNEIGE